MYRVWMDGRPDHLEASFAYLPMYAELVDLLVDGEWIPFTIYGKSVFCEELKKRRGEVK